MILFVSVIKMFIMRKAKLFPLIALLVFNQPTLFAQSWNITGNTNATVSSRLGTNNNIPLRFFTNNAERMRITEAGRVGIGIVSPLNILTVKSSGGIPIARWINPGNPLFAGFGENATGNADFLLNMASNTTTTRPLILGRRARGTLALPALVQNNDVLLSILASGYDGTNFQDGAGIEFIAEHFPVSGRLPVKISLSTGSTTATRVERLQIGSTGNFFFNGGEVVLAQSTGNLGIGVNTPTHRLDVNGASLFNNSTSYDGAITGINNYADPNPFNTGFGSGVHGQNTNNTRGVGVWGSATVGTGVYGEGPDGVVGYATADGTGVSAYSDYGQGGYFHSYSGTGIYIDTYSGTGLYVSLRQTNSPSYAGIFEGKVSATAYITSSDRDLKKNINDLGDAMTIINKLKPKIYEFRTDGKAAFMNLPPGRHYGLIAQELEEVLPTLVSDVVNEVPAKASEVISKNPSIQDDKISSLQPQKGHQIEKMEKMTTKGVNYMELIPIMIKAIQEQQQKMDDQQKQIEELKNQLNKLAQPKNPNTSLNNIILDQNTPNPFDHSTSIHYAIPPGFPSAQLWITDYSGKTIKKVDIASGSGTINLDGSFLSSGNYNYSLIIDGKVTQTKKMIITK
jgi:Chaperone of endosialidase